MAKKVVLQSVCDLCDSREVAGTFRFGWDLVNYEVDLCREHAEELTEMMERMVSAGRRLGSPAKSVSVPGPPPHPRDQVSTLEVRKWAQRNGIEVSERGRIPDELFERFLAARSAGIQAAEASQSS